MSRWTITLFFSLVSCAEASRGRPDCQALGEREAVIERCFGGDLAQDRYVGDSACWPFSSPQRMSGIWVVDLEASYFYPNANSLEDTRIGRYETWLESPLNSRPDIVAAGQGAGMRAYRVDFTGRRSLCEGHFGHQGGSPHQVIVDRFHSMRELPVVERGRRP